MKKFKGYHRMEWEEVFVLFRQLESDFIVQKVRHLSDEVMLEDWPEGEGFGSSDSSGALYNQIGQVEYDRETETSTYPETVEEMREHIKKVFVRLIVERVGFSERLAQSIADEPEGYIKLMERK